MKYNVEEFDRAKTNQKQVVQGKIIKKYRRRTSVR